MKDVKAMPARLEGFLAAVEPGRRAQVTSYELITGGYSRVMARACVVWDDGTTETLVLRGDPPPAETLIDSDRDAEWRLLQALHATGGVAVPEPRWYEANGTHLGTKCIVMEGCPGPQMHSTLTESEDLRPAADEFVDTLATIHAVDLASLPGEMPRPTDWASYLDDKIRLWTDTEAGLPDCNPVLRYVAAWLRANRPPEAPLVLVHGDPQPSNIVLDERRGHVVVDWEFARIGDPREDLGYYLSYSQSVGPSLYSFDPEAFLARYRRRTGLSAAQVNQATVGYFSLIATLSTMATIMNGVAAMAGGATGGTMVTYNINAIGYMNSKWLETSEALTEPLAALRRTAGASQ
ncbi:MAG TPA: phosphotransferase family protein [Acidimicrobiales bacterium]|nr:phosphotransferase family protein [Acidimicrobiales bacterium]